MRHPLMRSGCLLALSASALPGAIVGQEVELDLRTVKIDYDPVAWIAETGEQIPSGIGVAARLALQNWIFLEVEASGGSELRRGAICGGFIEDPERECIPEQVQYSGGLKALSIGWPGHLGIGRGFALGLRPKIGVARVRAEEVGSDTGRRYYESQHAWIAGVAVEISYSPPVDGIRVLLSTGRDRISPDVLDCFDCKKIFWENLPQTWYSLGVAWRWLNSRSEG